MNDFYLNLMRYFPPSSFVCLSLPLMLESLDLFNKGKTLEGIVSGSIGISLLGSGIYDIFRKVRDPNYNSSFFYM